MDALKPETLTNISLIRIYSKLCTASQNDEICERYSTAVILLQPNYEFVISDYTRFDNEIAQLKDCYESYLTPKDFAIATSQFISYLMNP